MGGAAECLEFLLEHDMKRSPRRGSSLSQIKPPFGQVATKQRLQSTTRCDSNPLHPPPPDGRVELEDLGQRDCPARACPPAKKSRGLRQFGYLTPSTLPPEQQFRQSGGVGRHRDEPGALDQTDLDRLRHGALNDGQNR